MTKVLVIGAHNDECEYGCGGITYLLKQKGCEVLYLNPACLWHRKASEEEKRAWEAQEQKAAEILGAKKIIIGDRDGNIYRGGADMILEMEKVILDYMPDIVFLHWPEDNHLEHRQVAKDSFEACCIAAVHGAQIKEIYAFEAGLNQSVPYFVPDFRIRIADAMPTIKESLMCFDQPTAGGAGLYREKEKGASYRGGGYSEGFRIIKFPNGNADLLLKELLNEYWRWEGYGMYPAYNRYYW